MKCFDYRNGNTAWGADEGDVQASRLIKELQRRYREQTGQPKPKPLSIPDPDDMISF